MSSRVVRFADVRGHDDARAFLQAAVRQDRLAHALLFAGAEGIGKRLIALAFAAWVQCENQTDDACGECPSCAQIAAESHPDVKVVGIPEKKKEIGVDRARDIKRFTQLRASRGRTKIALIDCAHALNVAAQNALLKTLEDPPNRSILILIANNPDALLPTVRSRCQRLKFQPLATATVRDILIAQGLDAEGAERLAAISEGSPGRALALRKHVGSEAQDYSTRLSSLGDARYTELMQIAAELAQPESATQARLEMLLAQLRDQATSAARASDALAAARWLRRAEVVGDVANVLRYRTPNRQLLLDALMLRLAKI